MCGSNNDYFYNDDRPILRLWSRGEYVLYVQSALTGAGYNVGPLDGIYGPITMQAVIDFQLDNGLVPDGIVGPMTWAAIDLIYP
ncbi:MAG TPA: peptidoglycan-binding domain-containing protein [Bacillota bacterium]|nr:peptidoglycan-binding domain-containing protein [Bacillota bacterium]